MDSASVRELMRFGDLLYRKGFLGALDGNLSVRLDDGTVLITRSGIHKGLLTADDFVVLRLDGTQIGGSGKPSSEAATHLLAYELRPEIHAVIHAHPVEIIALTLAGISLEAPILPEQVLYTGPIPTVPYAAPSSGDLAVKARPFLREYHTLMLARHGSLTLGTNMLEAFCRLEALVSVARTVMVAKMLGSYEPMRPEEVATLMAGRGGYR